MAARQMLGQPSGQREDNRAATLQSKSRGRARPTAGPQAEAGRPGRTPAQRALGNPANSSSPAGQNGRLSYRLGLSPLDAVERRLVSAAGVDESLVGVDLDALLLYQGRRRERAKLRNFLRLITELERVRGCGNCTVTGSGGPTLRRTAGTAGGPPVAGYAGLATCGSVWVCPTCSAKIAAGRAEELAQVMRAVLDSGGSAHMMTFTMRHHAGQSLRQCWKAAAYAWERITQGKQWKADQLVGGMLGWVKAIEVTHGANGWHVHIHVLVCWTDRISEATATVVAESMHRRWQAALIRKGFDSWRDSGGLDVRAATLTDSNLADYFVKMAHEITGSAMKKGRGKGRTPFQILRDTYMDHLARDGELWAEWEHASKGRKQLTWSRNDMNLRAFAQLGKEQTDEEIAAEDLAGDDLVGLPAETWGWIIAHEHATDLLDVTELAGLEGACDWLDARSLDWFRTSPDADP